MLISLGIDVGVGSVSVVAFGIVRVICPFVLIIIAILLFAVVSNVTFSSTYFTTSAKLSGVRIVVVYFTEIRSYSYSKVKPFSLIRVLSFVYQIFLLLPDS